jgi:hypothetical protein
VKIVDQGEPEFSGDTKVLNVLVCDSCLAQLGQVEVVHPSKKHDSPPVEKKAVERKKAPPPSRKISW